MKPASRLQSKFVESVKSWPSRLLWRSENAQSLIELALLTPLLLVLLIGLAEMGRYAYFGILVGNAARAGAAFAAQNLADSVDTADINTAAQNDCQNCASLSTAGLNIISSASCGCDNGGTTTASACSGGTAGTCAAGHWVVTVTVTASGTFKPMFTYPAGGLFGFLGIPSLTFSSTATQRVAQ
jgi:Flp pilus assembly protein TadG